MSKEVKIQINELSDKFAVHMVSEMFRHMEAQTRLRGEDFGKLLPGAILSRFVGALLFRTLKAPIHATTEEGAYNQTLHNYALVKVEIQEAIALGFQMAMAIHSGLPNEYYCQIKVVPNVPTKHTQ